VKPGVRATPQEQALKELDIMTYYLCKAHLRLQIIKESAIPDYIGGYSYFATFVA
jgi:hypothetical protein